jgi:hypothetical protein
MLTSPPTVHVGRHPHRADDETCDREAQGRRRAFIPDIAAKTRARISSLVSTLDDPP